MVGSHGGERELHGGGGAGNSRSSPANGHGREARATPSLGIQGDQTCFLLHVCSRDGSEIDHGLRLWFSSDLTLWSATFTLFLRRIGCSRINESSPQPWNKISFLIMFGLRPFKF